MATTSTLQQNVHKRNINSATSPRLKHDMIKSANFSHRFISYRCLCNAAKYEPMVDEEVEKIRRLQNGSDVRGVAVTGEKGRTVDLTPAAVEAIAESFGEWVSNGLKRENGGVLVQEVVKVSLGRDPRISGAALSVAVFAGLRRAGCAAFDMGIATTPACFMSTLLPPFSYDASLMMTASHLPYTRNGLKFFTPRGGLSSTEVEEICNQAAYKYANRLAKVSAGMPVAPVRVDFMSAYAKHLRDIIKERVDHPLHYDTPLKGFNIIVNAGNGSGGFFTWDVLDKLGADTFGSLNLRPDGMFPNHIPNPEDKVAMSVTREAVLQQSAHLGIVFDTDVDRSGVVDDKGNPINGDKLIALMSSIVLREYPGTTIVTDARTTMALTRFITERGGRHCLYRVGYRNVIDKGITLNKDGVEAHLMMETSGHGALKENHFLDDGAYMVVKIIIEMVRMKLAGSEEGIGSLIKDLEDPTESIELRMNICTEPRYAKEKGVETIETFREYIEEGRLEGWELDSCGDCWVSEGCLVDSTDTPTAIDAHMYSGIAFWESVIGYVPISVYVVRHCQPCVYDRDPVEGEWLKLLVQTDFNRAKISDEEQGQHGWIHIRQSIHNPNIAINMQSAVPGGCQSMARVLLEKFIMESGINKWLDVSEVEKFTKYGSIE